MSSGVSSGAGGGGSHALQQQQQQHRQQQEEEDLEDLFPPANFSMIEAGVYRSECYRVTGMNWTGLPDFLLIRTQLCTCTCKVQNSKHALFVLAFGL